MLVKQNRLISVTFYVVAAFGMTCLAQIEDFARCPCDLTGLACDVNCCCDQDCSVDDRRVFSSCYKNSYRLDDKLCFDRDVILFENGPEYSNTTDSLFCIYFDNEEERNYYNNPSLITTEAKIQEYVRKYGKYSFQPLPVATPLSTLANYYKSGDPLYVVFDTEAVSNLALPTAMSESQVCTDSNSAAYLIDQSFSCMRTISSWTTDCETTPALQASTFFSKMRLVRDPFLLQAFNSTTTVVDPVLGTVDLSGITSLFNNAFTLEFVLNPNSTLRCIDTNQVESQCGFTVPPTTPTWDINSNTCQNVLTKVEYTFVTEGTFGVQNAFVSFVFSDITASSLTQTFQTTFRTNSDSSSVVQRSGNPGYLLGQPIIAGILNQTTSQSGNTEQEIVFEKERGQQVALVRPSVDGTCGSADAQREPVLFGQNMRTGCFIQVTQTGNDCAVLQNEIINALEGYAIPAVTGNTYDPNYRYVATFGDSITTKTGDWVEILYQNRPTPPSSSGDCELSLGMDIQIIYANVGALPNPQPKIIGVSFVYDQLQIVNYRCSGQFCQGTTNTLTQKVEISSSVTFIDASDSPQDVEAEYPTFAVRLPYDFFYPFLNAGNINNPGNSCLIVCLVFLFKFLL